VFLSIDLTYPVTTFPCRSRTQNRRQKVFNRGALQFCDGALRLCGILKIVKLTKTPLIYSVSRFNLGGLGALFGGLNPPKPLPWLRDWSDSEISRLKGYNASVEIRS